MDGAGESEAKSGRRPRGDSGEMPPRRFGGSVDSDGGASESPPGGWGRWALPGVCIGEVCLCGGRVSKIASGGTPDV